MSGSLVVCAAVAVLAAAPAAAQDYPVKRITLVVPNTAGGAIDTAARLVSPKLSEYLGQPIVVENRPTAGGVLASNQVALAAPDGYTLLAVLDSFATNPHLFSGVQYDPVKSFAPISLLSLTPQALIVHPSLPVRTVKEFVALARAKGQAISHASAGPGTSSRLSFELFKGVAKIETTVVHYKGGAPALIDVMGGHVPVMICQMGIATQPIKQGRVIALAVTSARRSPLLPDVPTIAEIYPGFEAQSWAGLVAPAATPPAIVERLNGAVVKALAAPDVRERYAANGSDATSSTPEVFGAWLRAETAKWERVILERKIRLD